MMTFFSWVEWNYVSGSCYYGVLGDMLYNLMERHSKKRVYSLAAKWIAGSY